MIDVLVVLVIILLVFVLYLIFSFKKNKMPSLNQEFSLTRRELASSIKDLRQEIMTSLTSNNELIENKIDSLREKNDHKLNEIRQVVEVKLETINKDNTEKLEKMRQTVDEKLQSTLEKRLSESFKLVSERLELVQRGLGEMHNLANDVGDFKKIITNVKTRGTWGEVQLENLLNQIFIKDHYLKQVKIDQNASDVVDFCIKIPNKTSNEGFILLPIDAKFPIEDYRRLLDLRDSKDLKAIDLAQKNLITRIKNEAKSIKEKYIKPPTTTDFAILYLPIEGLYAEMLNSIDVFDDIQQTYRVILAGPTTIAAILNSFQLGFRTLAIAEQTSKVWDLLTNIRTEFGHFSELLDKTQEKLNQASKTLSSASSKSRTIEKKLSQIQTISQSNNKESIKSSS
jgi:DNA recombination protein RmuC